MYKKYNVFKKIINEYYITQKYNYAIIFTYFFIILFIVLQEFFYNFLEKFDSFNDIVNHYGIIVTCIIQILLMILSIFITNRIKNKNENLLHVEDEISSLNNVIFSGVYSIEDFDKYYNNRLILHRNEQIKKLKNILNYTNSIECRWVYLTGESGDGKSTILKILQKDLKAFYYNSNYFDWNNIYEKIIQENCEYVFLDQFETALKYKDDITLFFQKFEKTTIKFILAFRKEFLVDVEKILGQRPTHIIFQDDFDKREMILMIGKCFQCSEKTDIERIMNEETSQLSKRSKIIRTIITEIKHDDLPMIAFEIVGTIIEKNIDLEEFIQDNLPARQLIESVINFYFSQILPSDIKDRTIALSILYLLSKDKMLKSRFCIEDFKNITFAKESDILSILDYLEQNRFIKKVNETEYEISHDYVANKVLYLVSAESVNADILKNIDYYFHHICLERFVITNNKLKDKLKKRYKTFNLYRNEWIIHISMFVMCFLSTFLLFLDYHNNTPNLKYYEKIIITILVGLSVFYVYNFLMNFLKMFTLFWIPAILCIPLISMIFYNFNFWIISLGAGITILGLSHLFILKPIDRSARKYLKKNSILFSCFGITIFLVGLCNLIYQTQGVFKYFWYIFYFLYIMGAIMGHITPDYFAIRIGKANAFKHKDFH